MIGVVLTAAIGIGGSLLASHYGVDSKLCNAAMTAVFVISIAILFFS